MGRSYRALPGDQSGMAPLAPCGAGPYPEGLVGRGGKAADRREPPDFRGFLHMLAAVDAQQLQLDRLGLAQRQYMAAPAPETERPSKARQPLHPVFVMG